MMNHKYQTFNHINRPFVAKHSNLGNVVYIHYVHNNRDKRLKSDIVSYMQTYAPSSRVFHGFTVGPTGAPEIRCSFKTALGINSLKQLSFFIISKKF